MSNQTEIQKLYVAYFNRPADAAGLAYWENVIQSGAGNLAAISAAFARTPEYKLAYGADAAQLVVGRVYQNLFGRAAEAEGLAYWSGLLQKGSLSIDAIVKNIADGAQGSDIAIYNNKVLAASAFTAALDTALERDAYQGPVSAASARAYLASVTTGPSLASALATLDAGIAAMLKAAYATTLSQAGDYLLGSAGDDSFSAPAGVGGQDTFQPGDYIDGGAGKDSLHAVLSQSAYSAVVRSANLETVSIRSNQAAGAYPQLHGVQLQAGEMLGVEHWVSERSTADLLIMAARIDRQQSTRDIIVEMRETDAGNVDLGVYFDAASVRSSPATSSALRIELISLFSKNAATPLKDNFYHGFAFTLDGVDITLVSPAIMAAETYAQLLSAIQAALAAQPQLASVTASLGLPFQVKSLDDRLLTGTTIVLTSSKGEQFGTHPGQSNVIVPPGLVPPASEVIHQRITSLDLAAASGASVRVVLDDVGRGGLGGDLVVGALSDDIKGIERFAIEVRDSSQLQTISSTNNALREVVLVNGATSSHGGAASARLQDKGDLAVLGLRGAVFAGEDSQALPGAALEHNGFGLTDVRVIDASAMTGKLAFSAALTYAALDKYVPALAVGQAGTAVQFAYTGGAGDDTMEVTIARALLGHAAQSSVRRAAVDVRLDGGAGDDTIIVKLTGSNELAYDNLALVGGAGNDRIVLDASAGALGRDRLVYAGAQFGNDVVLNFIGGVDTLDFTALGGSGAAFAGAAIAAADRSITVQPASNANDSAAEIAALYPDGGAATHLFIAYSSANVGAVYAVQDSAGGPVVAILVGSIDLSHTAWSTLTASSFA